MPTIGSRLTAGALAAAALTMAAGCGNGRGRAPDIATAAAPKAWATHSFPLLGVAFRSPGNWALQPGTAQYLVATIGSGRAVIAIWRYPRAEPLPADRKQIERARDALIKIARARDRTLRVERARLLFVARAPAIQLLARERIAGQPRTVRSTHVFADGAELVVDAYAPAAQFARVDGAVFRPLLASLRLTKPKPPKTAAPRRPKK